MVLDSEGDFNNQPNGGDCEVQRPADPYSKHEHDQGHSEPAEEEWTWSDFHGKLSEMGSTAPGRLPYPGTVEVPLALLGLFRLTTRLIETTLKGLPLWVVWLSSPHPLGQD